MTPKQKSSQPFPEVSARDCPTRRPPPRRGAATASMVSEGPETLLGNAFDAFLAVHPTVVLSVGDHHQRIAKDTTKRVVGVLLGEAIGGKTHASNSFGVPFEEDTKDPSIWYLDHHYLENMAYMFSKINKKERIIGWYSTGAKIKPADLEIHELLRRYTPFPIFLAIDIGVGEGVSGNLPIRAYMAHEEPCSDKLFRRSFKHIECGVAQFEAEEVGVEHLLRDLQNTSTSTRSTQIQSMLQGVKVLQLRLADVAKYIEDVVKGDVPYNPGIISNLQNVLNLCSDNSQSEIINAFQEETTSAMLSIFVGTMTRSVLALHDLVRNRMQLRVKSDATASKSAKTKSTDTTSTASTEPKSNA